MKRPKIEIYVEEECKSCDDVLATVSGIDSNYPLDIIVHDRRFQEALFRKNGVVICPATFVNGRLTFYGSFSKNDLLRIMQTA